MLLMVTSDKNKMKCNPKSRKLIVIKDLSLLKKKNSKKILCWCQTTVGSLFS